MTPLRCLIGSIHYGHWGGRRYDLDQPTALLKLNLIFAILDKFIILCLQIQLHMPLDKLQMQYLNTMLASYETNVPLIMQWNRPKSAGYHITTKAWFSHHLE